MARKDEILNYLKENTSEKIDFLIPLVEEMIFLENHLTDLKKYPFLKINPIDPTLQKVTPAAKQYKDLSQTYLNVVKVLISCTDNKGGDEDSPLRIYLKSINK